MAPDNVLVGLIAQSVLADSLPRRRAAALLVEFLRAGENWSLLRAQLRTMPQVQIIIDEVRTLIVHYGLAHNLRVRNAQRRTDSLS